MTPAARRIPMAVGVALFGGVWLALLLYWVVRIPEIALGDYTTYWAGGRHLLDGQPLYGAWQLQAPFGLGEAARGRGYVYPPTSALLATPLAIPEVHVSWAITMAAIGLALWAVVTRIGRQQGLSTLAARCLGLVIVLSPPSLESLTTGNANELVAVGLGLAWLAPRTSGYLAVLGGLIKIYPILVLAWSIRNGTAVLKPIVVGVIAVAASAAILGIGPWQDFAAVLANGRSSGDFAVVSPRLGLQVLFGRVIADAIVYVGTGALALASLRITAPRAALFVLSVALILPAPDWYLHYFIVPVMGAVPWVAAQLAMALDRRSELHATAVSVLT